MVARRDLLIAITVSTGFLAALMLLPEPPPLPDAERVAVSDVLLFDGEAFRESMDVVIDEGRISRLGPELDLPADIKKLDGRGHTLMPGLIDAHTHVFGSALTDALAFGVTTELDMFSSVQQVQRARAVRDKFNATRSADLFSAGTLVTAPGGHGSQFGMAIPTLKPGADAKSFVADRVAEGSDFIKIVFDDGKQFGNGWPTLSEEQLRDVVAAAHGLGRKAVVHVSTLRGAAAAVAAGADGLVHLFADQPVDTALIELMRSQGTFVIPTLSVLDSFSGSSQAWTKDPRIADRLSVAQRQSLDSRFPFKHDRSSLAAQNLKALYEAGIPIVAGTDAPNPGTAHGASMHREMQLMVSAGMPVESVLRSATSMARKYFALGSRGRIVPGARADLMLVQGDIRQDIAHTMSLVRVWKNGFDVVVVE